MTRVTVVHGAPGCGKTTALLDAVEHHHREDDLAPRDVRLANFTNNGRRQTADDLVERDVFDLDEHDMDEEELRRICRTLHSIALRCVWREDPAFHDPHQQVITVDDNAGFYEHFCQQHGLGFDPQETNPLKLVTAGREETPKGNQLFAIDQWLHAMFLPSVDRPARLTACPVDIDLPNSRVRELLRAWDEHKRDLGDGLRWFEHHDYVDLCIERGYTPNVRLLCVDEFQDLSPVEYALYRLWATDDDAHGGDDVGSNIEWVYISGDVNQSIYSFRCASPYYLAETPVDDRQYLTDSYRCPRRVSAVARGILEAEPSITQNVFRTAARTGGHVPPGSAETRSLPTGADLAAAVRDALDAHDHPNGEDAATVYLLTRTNWQLGVLASALQGEGVPFDAIGQKMTPWPEAALDCLIVLRALRRGTPVLRESADRLLELATNTDRRHDRLEDVHVDRRELRYDKRGGEAVYFPEQVRAAFPGRETARAVVDVLDLPEYQQDMLRGALDTDAAPYPERVQVGTIHEAKGLQAPCVMLFTESTNRIVERYRDGENRAEEHRVYYVGATRASQTLYAVEGFFEGPTHPVFADGLPGRHDADNTTGRDATAAIGVGD